MCRAAIPAGRRRTARRRSSRSGRHSNGTGGHVGAGAAIGLAAFSVSWHTFLWLSALTLGLLFSVRGFMGDGVVRPSASSPGGSDIFVTPEERPALQTKPRSRCASRRRSRRNRLDGEAASPVTSIADQSQGRSMSERREHAARRQRPLRAGRGALSRYPALGPVETPYPPFDILSEEALNRIVDAAFRLLEEAGLEFRSTRALAILRQHGADVDEATPDGAVRPGAGAPLCRPGARALRRPCPQSRARHGHGRAAHQLQHGRKPAQRLRHRARAAAGDLRGSLRPHQAQSRARRDPPGRRRRRRTARPSGSDAPSGEHLRAAAVYRPTDHGAHGKPLPSRGRDRHGGDRPRRDARGTQEPNLRCSPRSTSTRRAGWTRSCSTA